MGLQMKNRWISKIRKCLADGLADGLQMDFENLADDISHLKGFWKNNITRVLLVVIFANIGSAIGTFLGGFAIASLL